MKYAALLFLLPSLAFAVSDSLNVLDCPAIAKAKCFEFRGRASSAMGRAGTRIWRIGTKRIFEVQNQTEAAYAELKQVDFHHNLFAQFSACPVEESKKGAMQGVCIQSVKRPRLKEIKD